TSLRWLAGALLVFAPALAPQAKELSPEKAYQWLEEPSPPRLETRGKAERRRIRPPGARGAPALGEPVLFSPPARPHAVQALAALLGEDHGQDYKAWIELLGRREDLVPKPGYVRFKASLYARIDPAFAEMLREEAPRTIRPEEIVW